MSDNKYDVDDTKVPSNGDLFFKRPDGKFYVRFYPCKMPDGTLRVGQHVVSHWADGQRFECTGKGCEKCKEGLKKTHRKRVGVVVRAVGETPVPVDQAKVKLWDAPMSVWNVLYAYIEENGDSCIADSGVTFRIDYDRNKSPASQYSVIPAPKDKVVFDLEKSVPFFDRQAAVEEPFETISEEKKASEAATFAQLCPKTEVATVETKTDSSDLF